MRARLLCHPPCLDRGVGRQAPGRLARDRARAGL